MMVTKYLYMFVYTTGRSTGRTFLRLNEPVTKPEHIEAVEKFQNEQHGFTCAVVNFQLLDTVEAIED